MHAYIQITIMHITLEYTKKIIVLQLENLEAYEQE